MARSGSFGAFLDSESLKELASEFLDGEDERLRDDGARGDTGMGIGGGKVEGAGCLGRCNCFNNV